jgi:integrase family protein with SAM-like domain
MGKSKGIIYAALERLDVLMAPGEKRSEAKAVARQAGQAHWTFTDGKMHAYQTRTTYQQQVMHFIQWCRAEYGMTRLDQLDACADELASCYLSERIAQGYSAWTLQTERSALRLFFANRQLAAEVVLPQRKREHILRSRGPAVRDAHIQPQNWSSLIHFLQACGLRREEVRDLFVRDVYTRMRDGQLVVHVSKGKGGKEREVPVFPGREQVVLQVIEGRAADEKVFQRLPVALDIHAIRRTYAQELYEYIAQRPLPPSEGRLQATDFDRAAAEYVTRCLGHNRISVIFGHYIR